MENGSRFPPVPIKAYQKAKTAPWLSESLMLSGYKQQHLYFGLDIELKMSDDVLD